MTIKYIAADGTVFSSPEKCQKYESENSKTTIKSKIDELTQQRELAISLKNRYKANKYGKLPTTERELQTEYDGITKMSKIPIEKISDKNLQYLLESFKKVEILRLQKKQQIMIFDDLRVSIKENGEKIKDLVEKLNS